MRRLRSRRLQIRSAGATTKELASEFTGSALFQLIGGAAPAALAAPANAFALVAMIYAFGSTSGAHLNPAVSFMLLLRGKISGAKAFAYMATQVRLGAGRHGCHMPCACAAHGACRAGALQVAGCVLGALICSWIIPGVSAGMGLGAPGTFAPAAGLSTTSVFLWEALMTAGLGLAVYGAAVAKSGFSSSAPLGIGAAVLCAVMTAGQYSGCVINPARALGPAIVFGLSMGTVAVYVAAQMAGGALAAVLAGVVHNE